jgi:hypothetical protein
MRRSLLVLLVTTIVLITGSTLHAEEQSSIFPLGRSSVGEQELPLPLGIGITYYYQEQDYGLKSIEINPIPLSPQQLSDVEVENRIDEINLQADLWVLPFLNVFGIIGGVSGETTVKMGPYLGDLVVDYDGWVYGGGFTAAAGVKRFFGSFTTHFMLTDLEGDRSSVKAWLLTPKAGIRWKRGALWGGAVYQRAEEEHRGSIAIPPFGELEYKVVLEEKNPWNYLVGGQVALATHWVVEAEGGFGKRQHALVKLTYRR